MDSRKLLPTSHWQYGRLEVHPLGGRNAIGLQFRQKKRYWAAELTKTFYLYRALVAGQTKP
jgi:hypothetical protein